ncbi:Retrovirus-related Pol polyprotein from transposon TNT 1-94 [Nymphaea thermarum]|nr:Retrovirus-related Pol polyprotein from transposon TNT 1-94 [Nymphaea thermarum]
MTLWTEAFHTVVHVINRLPLALLDGKSPHFLLHQEQPHYDELRVFGCVCYVHIDVSLRNKFQDRAVLCRFIGYAENYKGYRCYNPKTGRVHISRHVVFYERRLQDPKATPMTLDDKNETYDTWLHAEILRQGAEMLPKQKEQATNEPETIVDTSLDSTVSLENMSSSPQQDDHPPRDNRFSGLVYSRRTVPTIAPRQSQRVRHPIDRWARVGILGPHHCTEQLQMDSKKISTIVESKLPSDACWPSLLLSPIY